MIHTASDGYKNKTDSTGLTPGATHVKTTHKNESAPMLNKPSHKNKTECDDPYPWLDPDDVRRNMTDEEIIYKYDDLSQSCLSAKEKDRVYKILCQHKKAFSL